MTAATEFAEALLAAARPAAEASDRFVEALLKARLSRDTIRRYAIALMAMSECFPRRIASILSICNEHEVRTSLIGNLLEEEGVLAYDPAAGVRILRERSHSQMARRFARAAGASEAEIDDCVAGTRVSRWFADAIRRGDWIGAFAYVAIGHEANVPMTFRQIVPPLVEHYGFTLDDLIFLTEHFVADERHGNDCAHLIARIARTDKARSQALEGSRRGGSAWRALPKASIGLASMTSHPSAVTTSA